MATIKRFEEIRAWQTARELTRRVYDTAKQGRLSRDYGLRNQLQRASVSIMSNIAEGFESDSQPQFIRFLGLAKASAGEVRAQLYVALDVGYVTEEQFKTLFALAEKCSRQLSAFMAYLKRTPDHRQIREATAAYELDADHAEPSNLPTFQPSNESS